MHSAEETSAALMDRESLFQFAADIIEMPRLGTVLSQVLVGMIVLY